MLPQFFLFRATQTVPPRSMIMLICFSRMAIGDKKEMKGESLEWQFAFSFLHLPHCTPWNWQLRPWHRSPTTWSYILFFPSIWWRRIIVTKQTYSVNSFQNGPKSASKFNNRGFVVCNVNLPKNKWTPNNSNSRFKGKCLRPLLNNFIYFQSGEGGGESISCTHYGYFIIK